MIFADKGYASKNSRTILAQKKLNNGIMEYEGDIISSYIFTNTKR